MSVFLLDDEPDYCKAFTAIVQDAGYAIEYRTNPKQALEYIRQNHASIRLVLLDLVLKDPELDGVKVLRIIKEEFPHMIVVMITGSEMNLSSASAEATRLGVQRFIEKASMRSEHILDTIAKVLTDAPPTTNDGMTDQEVMEKVRPYGLVGASPAIVRVARLLIRYAKTDLNVLLTGETGTGKKVAADILHVLSRRYKERLVTVDIVNISRELFQSELFGHVKGAFTGATTDKTGLFMEADKGTLFIDEIGDMNADQQANLLLPVQEKRIRPVGANGEKHVDVRFVCATNKDIPAMCRVDKFRTDLYHRLNGITIVMPPLRERREDIPLIAKHYVQQYNGQRGINITIDIDARELLAQYTWKGNVRELQQTLNRILATKSPSDAITTADVLEAMTLQEPETDHTGSHLLQTVVTPLLPASDMDFDRMRLVDALNNCNGNKAKAAAKIGKSRDTLYRWIKEFNVVQGSDGVWR
jgi:DNA-binding NtrC family response regulator